MKCRHGILCRGHQKSSETAILRPISSSESVTRSRPDGLGVQDQRRSRCHGYSKSHSAKPLVFFKNSSTTTSSPRTTSETHIPPPAPIPACHPRAPACVLSTLQILDYYYGRYVHFLVLRRRSVLTLLSRQAAEAPVDEVYGDEDGGDDQVCFAVAGLQLEEDWSQELERRGGIHEV